MTPDDWTRCEPWLAAALSHVGARYGLDDVKAAIDQGVAQLWAGDDCVMVTQMHDYPGGRVIEAWLAGGNLTSILTITPRLEEWAREQGCVRVEVTGRKGWERVLTEYRPVTMTLAKEL